MSDSPTLFGLALALACAAYYFGAGLAICIGYHRVLSHRSAALSKGLERLFVTLGLPAGTPIQWAGNHRFHHAHADQPDDPHSPRDGFWHAHNGWYIGRKDALVCLLVRARRALCGSCSTACTGPRSNQRARAPGPRRRRGSVVSVRQPAWSVPRVRGRARRPIFRRGLLAVRVGRRRRPVAHADRRSSTSATPSTASRTSSARGPMVETTWRATTGSSASSASATAGTPTTTASRGAPATASTRANGMSAGGSSRRSRASGWRATSACRPPSRFCTRARARRRRSMSTPPEPAPIPGPAPARGHAWRRLRRRARHHPARSPRSRSMVGAVHRPQPAAGRAGEGRAGPRRALVLAARAAAAAAPAGRGLLILVGLLRTLVPRALTSSSLLHRLIYFGLRHFVSPQANFLILRHFHLGSNVVGFLAANSGTRVSTLPLRPLEPADVKDHLFLQHDLNLYNFVISLNAELNAQGRGLSPPARIDFDAIDETPIAFGRFPRGPLNFSTRSRRSSSTRRSIICSWGSVTSRARTNRSSSTRPWASTRRRSWATRRTWR